MWHKCTVLLISSAGPSGSIAICWLADINSCVAIPLHYWTSQKVIGHECLCSCGYAIASLYFQAIYWLHREVGWIFALCLILAGYIFCIVFTEKLTPRRSNETRNYHAGSASCMLRNCLLPEAHSPPLPRRYALGLVGYLLSSFNVFQI